jgi:hypothetical protein
MCPNLGQYPAICLEGVRKTTEKLKQCILSSTKQGCYSHDCDFWLRKGKAVTVDGMVIPSQLTLLQLSYFVA